MMAEPDDGVLVVWWPYLDSDAARVEAHLPWLSADEEARRQRFRFERDRHRFLASRILLRRTLGAVLSRAPADVQLATDVDGKPRLTGSPADASPHFNLTHTDGLVACAVSRQGDVGLDAEDLRRTVRLESLAGRVLSPREHGDLSGLAVPAQATRFLEHWCVKEAVLKATGTGLRVSPRTVDVQFDGRQVRLLGPEHRDWQVRLIDVSNRHVLALAHRRLVGTASVHVVPFSLG